MRINNLYVKEFKNIIEKDFNFESHEGVTFLIGTNGSGKSNLLEFLSDIFYNLYADKEEFKSDFRLNYNDFAGNSFYISYQLKQITKTIDGNPVTAAKPLVLPNRIVAIYSGEETRLWSEYYEKSYLSFISYINRAADPSKIISTPIFPKMLYLNKYYWDISLLSLACVANEGNTIDDYIKNKLGIVSIDRITFKFGRADIYDSYSISSILDFIKRIDSRNDYTLDDFKTHVNSDGEYDFTEIFMHLYLASTSKENRLIESIDITINGDQTISSMSEGTKKRMLIKAALEFAGQEDTLFLLDEPDAHVHVSSKREILDMISEYSSNRHIFLTTHSPTLCREVEANSIILMNNGGSENVNNQYEAARSLVGERIAVDLLFSTRHIILVEGKIDCQYIRKAIELFKDDYPDLHNNLDFIPVGGTDGEVVSDFISQINMTNGRKIILIVDRDDAGLKCAKKILDNYELQKDTIDYLRIADDQYLIMLPSTTSSDKDTLIEDYFGITKIKELITNKINSTTHFNGLPDKGKKYVKSELLKFAENITNKNDMSGFRSLLDKIQEVVIID